MIKYIMIVFISLSSPIELYAQENIREKSDSIIVDKIIREKILEEESQMITIFDSSGRMFWIVKNNERFKAYSQYYKGKNKKKRKISLSKEDISSVNILFEKPEILDNICDYNCFSNAHSFTKVSIIIHKGTFFHGSFFSNCTQSENMNSVKKLYFSLR